MTYSFDQREGLFWTGGDIFETVNPAQPDAVAGRYGETRAEDIDAVFALARKAANEWAATPGLQRR